MNKKKYENALIWSLAILMIIGIGIGLWALKTLPFLPVIIIVMSPVMSFLIYKNSEYITGSFTPNQYILGILTINVICFFMVVYSNDRHSTYLYDILIKGHRYSKKEFIEGDGETVAHYETVFHFNPSNHTGEVMVDVLGWTFLIVLIGSIYINYQLLGKTNKV